MSYYVYVIQHMVSYKIYVGKAIDPNDRWYKHVVCSKGGKEKYPQHFQYLHAAMAKHGVDNFTFKTIEEFGIESDCLEAEMFWIEFFRSWDRSYGYNLTRGGEGASGRVVSHETRAKISKANSGKTMSEEHRQIMIKCAKAQNPSEETRRKRSISLTGKKRTEAVKQAQSERMKGQPLLKNFSDARKNTNLHGENSPKAKLTNNQATEIRNLYATKNYTMKQLSEKYGVGPTSISYIISYKTFK